MKKFLLSVIMIVMCAVTVLSGCNLFQEDPLTYGDNIVAEIDGVSITRRELVNYYISARNNNYNFTVEGLLEEVLNQKLIIREVKDNFADYVVAIQQAEGLEEGKRGLDNNEVSDTEHYLINIKNKHYYNEIIRKVFDALDDEILQYENAIRVARGESKLEKPKEETIKTDYNAEKKYESKVKLNGSNVEKYFEETEFESEAIDYTTYTYTSEGNLLDQQKAYNRFINGLIRSEKGKNLDTLEANVFKREVERIYRIYEDQELQTLFQEKYIKTLPLDNQAVVRRYKELVRDSYSKIYLEATDANIRSTYEKMMEENASSVYYHPYVGTDKGYIQVAHVLIKFADELIQNGVQELTTEQLTDIGNNIYPDDLTLQQVMNIEDTELREKALAHWQTMCMGKERYTLDNEDRDNQKYAGDEYGDGIGYMTIYNQLVNDLTGKSLQEKAEIINEYIYKYNQDPGMINASGYYAVSLDDTVSESLEKAFADEARRLYSEGLNSLGNPIYVNQFIDDEGNYSYDSKKYAGYHFIFVIGEYTNLCDIEDVDGLDESFALTLYNTRAMLGVKEKSLYDVIYDSLSLSDYEGYRTETLDDIKEGKTAKYYSRYYSDLL